MNLIRTYNNCKATGHSIDHDKTGDVIIIIVTMFLLIIMMKQLSKNFLILILMSTVSWLKQPKIFEIFIVGKVKSHKK